MHAITRQNELLIRVHREREEQMRLLTAQLLLLEANLRRKQGKIDGLLNQRDRIIGEQRERIRSLERELDTWRRGSTIPAPPQSDDRPEVIAMSHPSLPPPSEERPEVAVDVKRETSSTMDTRKESVKRTTADLVVRLLGHDDNEESLEDSDSAVVIEDDQHLGQSPTYSSANGQQVIKNSSGRLVLIKTFGEAPISLVKGQPWRPLSDESNWAPQGP